MQQDPADKTQSRSWRGGEKMIVLQSMDRFDSMAVLDSDTGQISWFSRSKPSTLPSGSVRGGIVELQQRTLCLYRREGALHFRVDDEDFALTEETSVSLVHVNETTNTIMLFRGEDLLFAWTYQRPVIDPPLRYDPTPFVEEEDFDFCLFVYNVANDPGRKARIYVKENHPEKTALGGGLGQV